ncbi:MAG: pseudaminic acid biosynthesis-associated methylase [Parvibaculum sp.]|nr:pseudaminic acid biosynthesis-associated methylase [Parvibaculum sp.]
MTFRTEQEKFWTGAFGDAYMDRNQGEHIVTSNMALFARILRSAPDVGSIVEFGCNIGLNLQALHRINPNFELCGHEINGTAADKARALGIAEIVHGTIIDALPAGRTYDMAFTKGVLIHINPDELTRVYDNLHALSARYVMVCEYYNPAPVVVNYRGIEDRLFKRDFAGEIIERFGMRLVDYGFAYHRDNYFPQDDLTWFLLEK